MTEAELQTAIATYIRMRYPGVLFHSDFGSGIKLTMWQAKLQKAQNGGRRAWPDMFIAKPANVKAEAKQIDYDDKHVIGAFTFLEQKYGLFLEIKKDGTRLYKKNGEPATEHIAEQAQTLERLREEGYAAEFACGFEEAKKIIDDYLGGKYAKTY